MDKNGNGKIGLDELKMGLKKIGMAFSFLFLSSVQGSRLVAKRLIESGKSSPPMADQFDTETSSGEIHFFVLFLLILLLS
jgi:hypothetical protein